MLEADNPSDTEAFHTMIQQIMTTARKKKYSKKSATSFNPAPKSHIKRTKH